MYSSNELRDNSVGRIQHECSPPGKEFEYNMQAISVLVADDDPFIRQCIRHALEIEGDLQVGCEAENGLQALVMADRHLPDVVLLEAQMPRMDGLEAARCLRKRRADVCIVVMSLNEEHRQPALDAGADEFIVKGCGCTELRSILRRVLKGKSLPVSE